MLRLLRAMRSSEFGVQCSEFAVKNAPTFCRRASLEALLEIQHSEVQDSLLKVKFDRQDLIIYLESLLGFLPPDDVTLTVTGELKDGRRFEGSDTIRVIDKGGKKN